MQELDDLMMSLNDFKLKDREDEPVSTNLDVMLGNLREDMDKQGGNSIIFFGLSFGLKTS